MAACKECQEKPPLLLYSNLHEDYFCPLHFPKQIKARESKKQALQGLRERGYSIPQIADMLGISIAQVRVILYRSGGQKGYE